MKNETITLLTKKLKFWNEISEDEKNLILNNYTIIKYKKGEHLFSKNNDCLGVIIVKKGQLRSYLLSDSGREIGLYKLNVGDLCILSASCILKKINFDINIDANEDSEIILINSTIFEKLQSQNLLVENFALKEAVGRFSDVMWSMEQLLFLSFEQRLCCFLIDETNKGNKIINLTHEEIAKSIGSAREVVSRTLKNLENQSILSLSNKKIKILDIEALRLKTL